MNIQPIIDSYNAKITSFPTIATPYWEAPSVTPGEFQLRIPTVTLAVGCYIPYEVVDDGYETVVTTIRLTKCFDSLMDLINSNTKPARTIYKRTDFEVSQDIDYVKRQLMYIVYIRLVSVPNDPTTQDETVSNEQVDWRSLVKCEGKDPVFIK